MIKDETVSVLVPAYRAGGFISDTLQSVAVQTHDRLRVIISIDRCAEDSDTTFEVCAAFAKDERFEIHRQSQRVGWVNNVNSLLERVETPYFMIMFHDDTINQTYIESLLGKLVSRPDAVNAYPSVELVGDESRPVVYQMPDSDMMRRLSAYLTQPSHAVFQRGLTRKTVLDAGARLPENFCNGYLSDIVYSIHVLSQGACLHEPAATYRKLTWEGSVSKQWFKSPPMEQLMAAAQHLGQCSDAIDASDLAPAEKLKLTTFRMFQLVERLRSAKAFEGLGPEFDVFASLVMMLKQGDVSDNDMIQQSVEAVRDPSLSPILAKIKFHDAVVAMEAADIVGAAAAFADAARLDLEDPHARINLALMLSKLNQFEEAEAACRDAVQLAPDNARALGILAQLCVKNDRRAEAAPFARRAVAVDPEHKGAQRILDMYASAEAADSVASESGSGAESDGR